LDLNSDIILDSRLGFYAQPNAFKVLLDVSEEIAGERIYKAERDTDRQETLQAAIEEVHNRNKADFERYLKLYNIDLRDQENYDLVIDT
jgi:cytidylate kinase